MQAKRLSTRKPRGLCLRFELKLSYQQIVRSCSIAVGTVHAYLKRAGAVGLTWQMPEGRDEARVRDDRRARYRGSQ